MEDRGKPWWASKTIWANTLALAAVIAMKASGLSVEDGDWGGLLAGAMATVNIVLRYVTKEPIE